MIIIFTISVHSLIASVICLIFVYIYCAVVWYVIIIIIRKYTIFVCTYVYQFSSKKYC